MRSGALPIVAMLACATAIVSPGLVAAQNGIVHPEAWPKIAWPVRTDAAAERRIADLLARMSVEEKVGQIIQADIASITPEDVERYQLGSILAGGNSAPGGDEPRRRRTGWSSPTRSTTRRWIKRAAAARHPGDLGHRRGARPQQHRRRDALPAQYRPRRDARSRR